MSETISEPEKNVVPIWFSAGRHSTDVRGSGCLGLALLVSFLFTRYFAYRTVQENFYGQAYGARQTGVRLPSRGSGRKSFSAEPNARESRVVLLRVYSLSECLSRRL